MIRKSLILTLTAVAVLSTTSYAQISTVAKADETAQQKLAAAAKGGITIPVDMTVSGNAEVQAVLLTPKSCESLFGKNIAQSYAAVMITVSNKSQDYALVLNSAFLDYTDWLMSGSPEAIRKWYPDSMKGLADTMGRTPSTTPYQVENKQNQIASAEYRIVRGQALATQPWTARNVSMRALDLLAALATGSEFAFREQGIIKGIGVFSGQFVPGVKILFPDNTVQELNNISDVGFRANMTIPKASSNILVGFFPIDRFLTPGFKKLFLKSPAVFFVPSEALADPQASREITPILKELFPPGYLDNFKLGNMGGPNGQAIAKMLFGLSLNNVRVVISGIMTVDPDTIPARLDSVTCDQTDGSNWKSGAAVNCVIQGSLLANGQAVIDEKIAPELMTDATASTPAQLHFSMTLSKDQVPCGTLHVHVTKNKNNSTLDSNTYLFTIPGAGGAACPAAGK